jgi:L-aminopeptidase/D-esterase-like protein
MQMTTSSFLTKMLSIVDELAAAGEMITVREHVSFILAGLGAPYNALVAALGVVRTLPTLASLYAQIHAYDHRQEILSGSPTMDFETVPSAKAADDTTTVHVVIAATILIGVTTVARIAMTTAGLAKVVEEGEHPLEGDVAADVAGIARRPGST